MHLKILGHPIFTNLNFHMPMIVDLSHPLVMLQGENGAGKSTLLHSIFYALRGDQVEGYVYRLEPGDVKPGKAYLFDAEQHNPRTQLELFKEQPEMVEFLRTASHGQVMLSMFRETFPKLPEAPRCCSTNPKWRFRFPTSAAFSKCSRNWWTGRSSASSAPPTRPS